MSEPSYYTLLRHYERCFAVHGATAKGMDWPNEMDVFKRFAVLLEVAHDAGECVSLLDLGCGYGALYDYLKQTDQADRFSYQGIDLSSSMIETARQRHPDVSFKQRDILTAPLAPQSVDITIMNGVLTEKRELSFENMESFAVDIIAAAYNVSRIGVAFNVMSAQVDFEREDLFHWPFDRAAAILKTRCSRHIVFRADYGLYEYVTYVLRNPTL